MDKENKMKEYFEQGKKLLQKEMIIDGLKYWIEQVSFAAVFLNEDSLESVLKKLRNWLHNVGAECNVDDFISIIQKEKSVHIVSDIVNRLDMYGKFLDKSFDHHKVPVFSKERLNNILNFKKIYE